ncbi:Helix-turn-helix domain-containing protein [Paraburkholderia phenazinium]|uniref:Helix-turn-helix domain-containing protein n=1 Tax=Paraburkholderia phenazinium TaxID=60549 RepID=A0A1G7YG66_9BURK|nr:helix-turn-helix domain-containing protein [Paraburkholderia phenazinium]SDG95582.1 Helix-turn-helix domain-containing protein [Paraburkholderia phenazinium]
MPVPATTAPPKKQRDAQERRERVVGLISAAEAAARLGVTSDTIGRLAGAGRLGEVVRGPHERLYFQPEAVDAHGQKRRETLDRQAVDRAKRDALEAARRLKIDRRKRERAAILVRKAQAAAERAAARAAQQHVRDAARDLGMGRKTLQRYLDVGILRRVDTPDGPAINREDLAALKARNAATEGMLTRAQVATLLGVGVWTVERLPQRLNLRPLTGPRNWRYYSADDVARFREALAARSVDGLVNVLTAAQLVGLSRFTLLDYAQRGVLPPAARGRSNSPYFNPEDVTALIARRAAARAVPAGHVTQREACAHLGVSRQRLSQLVLRGHIRATVGLNGFRRFRIADLDAYRARNPRSVPCQGTTTKGRTMAPASGALAC